MLIVAALVIGFLLAFLAGAMTAAGRADDTAEAWERATRRWNEQDSMQAAHGDVAVVPALSAPSTDNAAADFRGRRRDKRAGRGGRGLPRSHSIGHNR